MTQSPQTNAKGFSKAFWVSNTVELFERMAYYAVFIVLTIYLSSILGFNDFEASMISGLFSGGLYLLPIFTGAYADKIGFRKSMIIAFSLLSAGYLGLGVLPTLLEAAGLVEYGEVTRFSGLTDSSERWMIVPVLFVIMHLLYDGELRRFYRKDHYRSVAQRYRRAGLYLYQFLFRLNDHSGVVVRYSSV